LNNDGKKEKSQTSTTAAPPLTKTASTVKVAPSTSKAAPPATAAAPSNVKPDAIGKTDKKTFILESGALNENLLAQLQERHEREKKAAESIRQKTQPHVINAVK